MKKLFLFFFSLLSFSLLSAQEFLLIEKATKPIIADGVIRENEQWGPIWTRQLKMTQFSTTTDMQSEFQLMYDSTNLYFAVRVTDGTRNVGYETNYLNDFVWLLISMDTTSETGEYKTGDWELRLQAVSDPDSPGGTIEGNQGIPENVKYACVDSGYAYIQEWILPWAELYADIDPQWDGEHFNFDVGTTDATSQGVRSQLNFWNDNSDLQYCNTNHFGYARLSTDLSVDNRSEQHINFDQLPTVTYGDDDILLSATSTSGLPVTFTSSNTNVAIVNGDSINIVGIGSSLITAIQQGNLEFKPANSVTRLLIVTSDIPAEITLFDFESGSADTLWTLFGNGSSSSENDLTVIANPDFSGINNSDSVLQFIIHKDANLWVGMFTEYLEEPIEITEDRHILYMMVYKNIVSRLGMKIEFSSDGGMSKETLIENTRINEWELLTFDMSDAIGHTYNRLTIFPDFPNIRTDSAVVLIDNISFGPQKGLVVDLGADKYIKCGDSVSFDPSINYLGAGELTFSWYPANGLSSAFIREPVVHSKSTIKYTLTVSSPDYGDVSESIFIYVEPFSAIINKTTQACGNTTRLNVYTDYTGIGPLTYNWMPANGLSGTNIPDPFVDLHNDSTYCVFIESPEGCEVITCVHLEPNIVAPVPSICLVTVDENERNVIVLKNEPNIEVDSFFIYRESFVRDQYDLIGIIPYSESVAFTDAESDARIQSHTYKIAIKDICGNLTDYSVPHKTIHLTGIGSNGNLIWEPYAGIEISSYRIYRGTSASDLKQIGITSGRNISFTDLFAPAGEVFYQLEGNLHEPCTYQKKAGYFSVRSNIYCNKDFLKSGNEEATRKFVYPNPTTGRIHLKGDFLPDASVLIFDLHGNIVYHSNFSEQIDVSSLPEGIYFVKLIDSDKTFFNKLVKE